MEDIRGHILRVFGVYLTYTTVTHALGAIKCTITELGVYASIYTPSYRPIRLINDDVMWYKDTFPCKYLVNLLFTTEFGKDDTSNLHDLYKTCRKLLVITA